MQKALFLLLVLSVLACSTPKEKIPDTPAMPGTTKKMVVYQMMTRLFANTNTTNKFYASVEDNGVGKMNNINDAALKGIKDLGVTHVWYTGIIEHALLTDYSKNGIAIDDADVVKGKAGSPYAIKDYYDVNPDLAEDVVNRMKEFEALVARTHAQDLKVIIDFVPNHVARAYKSDARPTGVKDLGEGDDITVSFRPTNNFYYLPGQAFIAPKRPYQPEAPKSDGKFVENPAKVTGNNQFTATPNLGDWFETVKLNYGVDYQNGEKKHFEPIPNTWEKMRDILVYWADKKIDGFRCDMAEMVPVEFWQWVIPQVKKVNPQIVFIAEIYNPTQYRNYIDNGQFDFLYDKVQLYDTLRLLVNQKAHSDGIPKIQESLTGINHNMLHFLENHDEQRFASPFFAGDAWKAVPAMVVSACIDEGPIMIYFGQEVGEPGAKAEGFSGDDGRTTMFDYWGVPQHQKWVNNLQYDGGQLSDEQKQLRQFYGDILTLAANNQAIAQGKYADLTVFNQQNGNFSSLVHAFVRYHGEEKLIIVSNFNTKTEGVKIQIPESLAPDLGLKHGSAYVGRDLLRSGAEIGIDANLTMSFEIPAFSSLILKVK
ncbi:MAG: alpha-amylase family protein [Bacteroidota bacterium]|jgi:glycosidase|nr:alpha-amylase family protein [Cytophagales bacterium]MCE2958609.1 alpha-amylase family protein [Flammeovirgaceae bacterium]MCZ8072465.1 alpha-amylase family protein [Cytophagales bacterium]